MVRGAVPGSEGGWVLMRDAVKRKAPDGLPFPAALRAGGDGSEPEPAETEAAEPDGAEARRRPRARGTRHEA